PGNISEVIAVTAAGIGMPTTAFLDVSIVINFGHRLAVGANLAIDAVIACPVKEHADAHGSAQRARRGA
nr:hypothetical protein [Tanacetum cinerariifolium]